MTLCKLTTKSMTTHNDTQWILGEWRSPAIAGVVNQCSPTALHFYPHPLIATLLNPVHARISDPRLFRVEVDGAVDSDGTKCWTDGRLRLVEELVLPVISIEQRIKFAILCAREVCTDPAWTAWAERWLSGADRTAHAARAADAADATYADAAQAAVHAAYAAARAARAAAAAADAADAAHAADAAAAAAAAAAAVYAAYAAYAARAAVHAADAADAAAAGICLTDIAKEATK